ncbi:MAG: lasso peptide biosynthesis B2 protein [Actinophytocola sp.]|uniref:lasso peptide biosynthesis B2 protein n=1 Tax=Actinophytocola sp. TaxID=1872138 RepID=UPI0013236151|nr:lasso peptide biosynthesis B2 protein [Actinophytocola sp.]
MRWAGGGGGNHPAAGAHPSPPAADPPRPQRAASRQPRGRSSQAERAFAIVTTVSLRCASGHGCLRRSLAIIVLCRLWGVRATWWVGFRSPAATVPRVGRSRRPATAGVGRSWSRPTVSAPWSAVLVACARVRSVMRCPV